MTHAERRQVFREYAHLKHEQRLLEQWLHAEALMVCGGSTLQAARLLGIGRSTMIRRRQRAAQA